MYHPPLRTSTAATNTVMCLTVGPTPGMADVASGLASPEAASQLCATDPPLCPLKVDHYLSGELVDCQRAVT